MRRSWRLGVAALVAGAAVGACLFHGEWAPALPGRDLTPS